MNDFDNKLLKPDKFFELCKLLNIAPQKLYDEYYSFVFSNFGEAMLNFRKKINLSQKQLAKIISISPVDLGYFERQFNYPSRAQYLKLKEVLKKYAKGKSKS